MCTTNGCSCAMRKHAPQAFVFFSLSHTVDTDHFCGVVFGELTGSDMQFDVTGRGIETRSDFAETRTTSAVATRRLLYGVNV